MACAVQINYDHRAGCRNCVVACLVDALGFYIVDPEPAENICTVWDRKTRFPDPKCELRTGCGLCVQACLHDIIRLTGPWETRAKVQ